MEKQSDTFPELGEIDRSDLGDISAEDFRKIGYDFIDWAAEYIDSIDSIPVLAQVLPGDIKKTLPEEPPDKGERFDALLRDFKQDILPGVTHWNHPSFYAYFAITGSVPGIFGDFLSTVLNVNAMLWKTCPSSTELEETVMNWAKKLLHVPESFFGMINDTASISSLNALAAARERYGGYNIRVKGYPPDAGFRIYCSDQAHSSIDKAAIVLGIGLENVVKIESDERFRMAPDLLEKNIERDRAAGKKPLAVVATLGTTSTTSIDPIPAIGEICRRHGLWLHVDGAYGGIASAVPEYRGIMDGFEFVDSYVTNAHKWMFTPFDASLFFVRDEPLLRRTFSVIPEYLTTAESGAVTDFMNYGNQLGRRFRALKLWFVMRYFGREGIINRLREHIRLARLFQSFVDESDNFELMAPVPFSVVCFRCNPAGKKSGEEALETLNRRLMDAVNATGMLFIEHTKLRGRYTLRLAVGHLRTTDSHIRRAWRLISDTAARLV